MEYLIGIGTVLLGALAFLFNQNQKLKSDKKLSDSAVQDARLETKQEALDQQSIVIKKLVDNLKPEEVNPAQSAEDFWNKRDNK